MRIQPHGSTRDPKSPERRHLRRYGVSLPGRCKASHGEYLISGSLRNMSSRGVYFAYESTERCAPGSSVTLWADWPVLNAKSRMWLVIQGEVVREDGQGVGISITRHHFELFKTDQTAACSGSMQTR